MAPTPSPSPAPTSGCSLRERQDWAGAQLREWYLFPETLPATLNPASYSTVDDYIDALTATAIREGARKIGSQPSASSPVSGPTPSWPKPPATAARLPYL